MRTDAAALLSSGAGDAALLYSGTGPPIGRRTEIGVVQLVELSIRNRAAIHGRRNIRGGRPAATVEKGAKHSRDEEQAIHGKYHSTASTQVEAGLLHETRAFDVIELRKARDQVLIGFLFDAPRVRSFSFGS